MSTLYLIPSPLGDAPLCRMMPPYNSDIIRSLRHFIVENVRTARRFLKQVDNGIDIDSLTFYELNRHTDRQMIASYLTPMGEGCDIGIISEAGCPAVADPGADVVAIAQEKDYKVVPLVGPSSILMSLAKTRRRFSSRHPTATYSCSGRCCAHCSRRPASA